MNQSGAVDLDGLREVMDPESFRMLEEGGGQVRGYVPEFDLITGKQRLVHWKDAAIGPDGKSANPRVFTTTRIPKELFLEGIPPIQRRSARQRYQALVQSLLAEMQRVKAVLGRVELPASIREQVARAAWMEGDPTLPSRIERAEPEAVEIYAAFLMRDVAAKQKEKDQKKVALDWHGHYNA